MCSSIISAKQEVSSMLFYELKKIFGRAGGKIALLVLAIGWL